VLKAQVGSSGGLLLLNEAYSKGWEAKVDGREAELKEVEKIVMGVSLPEGEHEVEFRYRMPGFPEGILITAVTAGLCFVLIVWGSVKAKKTFK